MSVLKNDRGTSDLEFYHTARILRRMVTQELLRDFGVMDKDKRKAKSFPDDGLRAEVVKQFPKMEIFFNKYTRMREELRTRDVVSDYPYWLVYRFRDEMMDYLKNLMDNITAANTIFPVDERELSDRRAYQTMAIANCEQILQALQYIMDVLPVDANRLLRYVELVEKEIALLKGWRKSNSKIAKRMQKQQEGNAKAVQREEPQKPRQNGGARSRRPVPPANQG